MQDHAMVIRADAKAIGAVTALDTRVSARWQASRADTRTFNGRLFTGTSECISYKNGTASIFRSTRTRKTNRVTPTVAVPRRITAADLQPIGDQNH